MTRARLPEASVPGLAAGEPGLSRPPSATETAPLTVPVPPSVPPMLTMTAPVPVPEPIVLLTSRVPAKTVVGPVKVLFPDKTRVPSPLLIRPLAPLTTPLTVSVWPAVTLMGPGLTRVMARVVVKVPVDTRTPGPTVRLLAALPRLASVETLRTPSATLTVLPMPPKVLAPPRTRAPGPLLVRQNATPMRTVAVRVPHSATNTSDPPPTRTMARVVVNVPAAISWAVPSVTVLAALPRLASVEINRLPPATLTVLPMPPKVLAPPRTRAPGPALVKLKAPLMTPLTKGFPSLVRSEAGRAGNGPSARVVVNESAAISSAWPSVTVLAALPRLASVEINRLPSATLTVLPMPPKVLVPPRTRAPGPALVKLKAPLMTPLKKGFPSLV